MSALYSLRVGAALDQAEDRLSLVNEMLVRISAFEDDAIMVMPAGFVQARSPKERDQWAEGLLETARDSSLGLVFGIDFMHDGLGNEGVSSNVYACEGGRRLLWPESTAQSATDANRGVRFASLETVILLGREIFDPRTRAVVQEERPELVIVLGHAGPTERWKRSLDAIDALAPTLFVHQDLPRRHPLATSSPRGFKAMSSDGAVQLTRYSRVAPASRALGLP